MFHQKSIKGALLVTFMLILTACENISFTISNPFSNTSESQGGSSFTSTSQNNIEHTVIFRNYDNSILSTQKVNHGDSVIYLGPEPVKPNTEFYEYSFAGWDKSLETVVDSFETKALFGYVEIKQYVYINNIEELISINNNLSLNYRLNSNIDLQNIEWTPIGGIDNPFTGTFDGQGKSIINFKITSNHIYNGLFGVFSGEIKNLIIEKVNIQISGSIVDNVFTGPVAGFSTGGKLNNIEVNNSSINSLVRADNYGTLGGVIGYINTSEEVFNITTKNLLINGTKLDSVGGIMGHARLYKTYNLKSHGEINSSSGNLGGIFGKLENFEIDLEDFNDAILEVGVITKIPIDFEELLLLENAINETIINKDISVNELPSLYSSGGIIGTHLSGNLVIKNSFNLGNIIGYGQVGGFIGLSNDLSIIYDCLNASHIMGYIGVGGIIGTSYTIDYTVDFNYVRNNGDIIGRNNLGGLIGNIHRPYKSFVQNSYNTGNVGSELANNSIGGLIGGTSSSSEIHISNSTNSGELIGRNKIGGLVGESNIVKIRNSFNSGSILGVDYVGGLIGETTNCEIFDSYNSISSVAGFNHVGGLIGKSRQTKLFNVFNLGNISGKSYIGGLMGGINVNELIYFYVFNSVNLGNVSNSINSTSGVGGIIGTYNSSYDSEKLFYSGSITSNGVALDGVEFGTKVTDLSTFNLEFFTTTLEWDTEIWDFTGLDIANGVYPTLKNMPVVED
jgi:hypothetical protein